MGLPGKSAVEEKIQACGLDQLTKLTYDKNPEERAGYE
jgi:hypothetical protein